MSSGKSCEEEEREGKEEAEEGGGQDLEWYDYCVNAYPVCLGIFLTDQPHLVRMLKRKTTNVVDSDGVAMIMDVCIYAVGMLKMVETVKRRNVGV